jgi:transketolase
MTDRDHSESTTATWGSRAFGSSAPLEDLLNKFGFTSGKVFEAAKQQLSKNRNMQT